MKPPTEAALLRRVAYSVLDISDARLMLSFAENEIPDLRPEHRGRMIRITRVWGLYSAAVVAYSRPFTRSRNGKFAAEHLPKEEFERRLNDSDLLGTHLKILATRHRLIAHGDPHARPLEIAGLRMGADGAEGWLDIGMDAWPKSLDDLEIPSFRALLDRVNHLLTWEWLGDIRDQLPLKVDLPPSPDHKVAPWEIG